MQLESKRLQRTCRSQASSVKPASSNLLASCGAVRASAAGGASKPPNPCRSVLPAGRAAGCSRTLQYDAPSARAMSSTPCGEGPRGLCWVDAAAVPRGLLVVCNDGGGVDAAAAGEVGTSTWMVRSRTETRSRCSSSSREPANGDSLE